jgi:hypothetical protein
MRLRGTSHIIYLTHNLGMNAMPPPLLNFRDTLHLLSGFCVLRQTIRALHVRTWYLSCVFDISFARFSNLLQPLYQKRGFRFESKHDNLEAPWSFRRRSGPIRFKSMAGYSRHFTAGLTRSLILSAQQALETLHGIQPAPAYVPGVLAKGGLPSAWYPLTDGSELTVA